MLPFTAFYFILLRNSYAFHGIIIKSISFLFKKISEFLLDLCPTTCIEENFMLPCCQTLHFISVIFSCAKIQIPYMFCIISKKIGTGDCREKKNKLTN